MGLVGRVTRTAADAGQDALGFGFPLEPAAQCLATSVRQFQSAWLTSYRPAQQIPLVFSGGCIASLTVSETVSENSKKLEKIVVG